jgi:hypothetical protein
MWIKKYYFKSNNFYFFFERFLLWDNKIQVQQELQEMPVLAEVLREMRQEEQQERAQEAGEDNFNAGF